MKIVPRCVAVWPRLVRTGWGLAILGLAGGCETYRPQPLTHEALEQALETPSLAVVQTDAQTLNHPLVNAVAIDGREGFTPEEIAVMTVIASPQLRALRDQRGVAEAQVIQAGLLPNPQLGYSLDQPHGNSDPTLVNGMSLGASWDATALLGYRSRVAAAHGTVRALELDIAWQEWQAAETARLTALRVLSLEERLPFARETEAVMADAVALERKAQARGYRTTVELAAMVEAWNGAQDARFALEQELTTQRLALNLALGQPAMSEVKLRPGADFPDLPTGPEAAAGLLDGFEKRRLDLVALTLGYESAEASLRAAVRAQFPKIGLSFGRARDTSDVKTRTFGITLDLPIFDRGQGAMAVGTATRRQLFDDYTARVAEARSEVVQILANLAITREQLRMVEAGLPEWEQLVAALDQAMKTRNTDVQAWRDAHGSLLARRTLRAKLRQDLLELGVGLEIATGLPHLTRSAAP
ncbi:MAG: TolC family protein [Opitutus sp.]